MERFSSQPFFCLLGDEAPFARKKNKQKGFLFQHAHSFTNFSSHPRRFTNRTCKHWFGSDDFFSSRGPVFSGEPAINLPRCTLPPIIMVQWKMGVCPILVSFHLRRVFHETMIMGGKGNKRCGLKSSHECPARFVVVPINEQNIHWWLLGFDKPMWEVRKEDGFLGRT